MAFLTDNPGVGVAYQIPRDCLALLMVSQVVVVLPLAIYISPWVVAVCLFCSYWRSQVHRGRWGYPASWVKASLVIASFVSIAFSGYTPFSLEAATSLLVLAFALKLLEMKNRRDAYLVIYLCYFLIATAFLFDQTIAVTAYEVFAAVVVTGAMVALNQLQSKVRPLASLRVAAGLIFQALPLTLVLFLLFPRIAPLWSIELPSAATTGISDHLTPGDVANLTQSDEVAFRVAFEGDVPAQRDLYWRGLVYSDFKNGTWAMAEPLDEFESKPQPIGPGIGYKVSLEPTQAKWLFSLDTPVEYGSRLSLLGDYRLVNPEPVMSVKHYELVSDPEVKMDFELGLELDEKVRERETALPTGDNDRIRTYATELLDRTGSAEVMIEEMLAQIRTEPYVYTLKPPTLPRLNSIDEFWFETRRGFCTHYAGAMVFALRAADIPARMVGGYQGGEVNSGAGYVVVRQYQAHAWIEAWLPGKGWTRFDPTGAVAPARVENGLNAALSVEDRETLSFLTSARLGEGNLLSGALQWADSLEYKWNLWVVGYDTATQKDVLKNLLGKVTPTRIGIALLIGGGLSMALVTIAIFWRRRPRQRHRVERVFQGFCATMARQGHARALDETPAAYVRRLAGVAQTDAADLIAALQRHLYNPEQPFQSQDIRMLRQELRKLRFKLAFSSVTVAS